MIKWENKDYINNSINEITISEAKDNIIDTRAIKLSKSSNNIKFEYMKSEDKNKDKGKNFRKSVKKSYFLKTDRLYYKYKRYNNEIKGKKSHIKK